MGSTEVYHGGDLQEAEALFGRPEAGWLDLSTGINPEPYPNTNTRDTSWRHLPQTASMETLLHAARHYYRVPESAGIVAAAGSQAILQLLPALLDGCAISIVGPTYAEHAKLWTEHGHQVTTVGTLSNAGAADVLILVNPNNPDGRTIHPDALYEFAETRLKKGGFVVVDEAFADLDPAVGILPRLQNEPILSIRSFGKFFGLPGLRLGFAAGAPNLISAIRQRLGPWAVSGPALEIGARALADRAWIERARERLEARADALDSVLTGAGLTVIGGTALYRLIEHNDAAAFFDRLGRAGIFVRRFQERPERLRFGVPGSARDLRRLKEILT